MERTAECCCGRVAIVTKGEPASVIACHCDYCQRRTGSIYQVSCWYPRTQVKEIRGETRTFDDSPGNAGVHYCFCPNCGSTVYWTFDYAPQYYGIAAGCFADPAFPKPGIDMFTMYRHHWVEAIGDESFEAFPAPESLPPMD